jgi:hypothetical protein
MKVLIKGWVHALPRPDWGADDVPSHSYHFFGWKTDELGYIPVCEASVEVDVPDDFNIVAAHVNSLEAERARALAEYQEKVASINERLSKLLAITNEGPTS